MGEGFRFDDIRRWKKLDYLGERKLVRWIVRSSTHDENPYFKWSNEGYVAYRSQPVLPPDYYYLYPIPSDQIVLNSKLEQNPGWQ